MAAPGLMCRKHLLGEHVEIHMLLGSLLKGKSIRGFIDKRLLEPSSLKARHDELAAEMTARGFAHNSPIDRGAAEAGLAGLPVEHRLCKVNRNDAYRELMRRCEACRGLGNVL